MLVTKQKEIPMKEKLQIKQTLREYWKQMKPYKTWLFVSMFAVLVGSLVDVIAPIFYKQFFDLLSGGVPKDGDLSPFVHALLFILSAHLVGWLGFRTAAYIECWRTPRVMTDLTQHAHAELQKQSYKFFADSFAGSLVRKVGRFERAYDGLMEQIVWKCIPLIIVLGGYLIVLFHRSTLLGWVLLVWIAVFLTVNIWFSLWKIPYETKRAAIDSERTGVLADSISNAVTAKLFSGAQREHSLFREVNERLRKMNVFLWRINETIDAIQALLMITIEFVLMYIVLQLWKQGILTIGDFVLIQTYLIGLFHKVWEFGRVVRHIYEAFADANEMVTVLEKEPDVLDMRRAKPLVMTNSQIQFKNVFFSFNKTRRILNDLNLVIESGEKIALIGPSGAGKSTITKLLLRFYDIERGKIIVGNQNITKVTQDSLRNQIAVVPQEPLLFHRSVLDNIRYGRHDATDEEVIEAAKKAQCHEFIAELQDGYKTFVGERGVKLSGGERQRIAIARAILKDAPILLLDEATSSLDSESEQLIQMALHELMKGKTTIVIAHRLSTIMEMDRIVVIEHGKVVDTGTHKQLIGKKSGIYKNLWEIQAGGFLQ